MIIKTIKKELPGLNLRHDNFLLMVYHGWKEGR
ncbi:hypothetical protein ES708_22194 [subsurface metagenome]